MVTFLKAFHLRIFNTAGARFGDTSSRLYGVLLPMLDSMRADQPERTTSTSPFVGLDGRLIDHEEERLIRFD